MRIAYEAFNIKTNNTGTGYYSLNLLKKLAEIDQENKYLVFLNKNVNIDLPDNFKVINSRLHLNTFLKVLYIQFVIPFQIKRFKVDILHGTSFALPFFKNTKHIVTIHDLAYKIFKKTISKKRYLYYNIIFGRAISNSDLIISVSKNTKTDIVKFYGDSNKVLITPLGINPIFKKSCKTRESNPIDSKYILAVGSLEPRKNLRNLVEAFNIIQNKIKNYKLVIVGARGWRDHELFYYVNKYNLKDKIIFTGYLNEDDLVRYYQHCELFVYPSVYEGFGLPLLEAMALKKPMVVSNTSSIPEVAGKGAVYFDPQDVRDMADKIILLLTNPHLQKQLVKNQKDILKNFDWHITANETIKAYYQFEKESD